MAKPKYSTYSSNLQKAEVAVTEKQDEKPRTGAYTSIILAAAIPSLLVLSVTGVLIGLTLKHRVIINTGLPEFQAAPSSSNTAPSSNFDSLVQTGGSNAYYIDFNPSSLTTIASVTGKFIPYLSSAVTGIAAFFAANTIHKITQNEQDAKLLTPKQMSIMLGLLLSGWQGTWDSICYRVKKGNRFNGPLLAVFITLTVTTLLGFIIPVIDTWFGIVVVPKEQTQLQVISPPTHSFSRGLNNSSDCIKLADEGTPCNIGVMALESILESSSEGFKIANNVSTTNVVNQFAASPSQMILYLADAAAISSGLDYKASTFAASAQCQSITYKCVQNTNIEAGNSDYNCTSALQGDFNEPDNNPDDAEIFYNPSGARLFTNASLTETTRFSFQNPVYFAAWATRVQIDSRTLGSDSGIVASSNIPNVFNWILNCSATFYEATYAWVNGSVISLNTTLVNDTMGGILSAPLSDQHANDLMQVATNLASVSNSSAEISTITANYVAHLALSLSIGAIDSRANLLEQSRSTLLLTRVPTVPFYLLIAFKLVYVLGVVLFAIAAIILTHPSESAGIRVKLTIDGLMTTIYRDGKIKSSPVASSEDQAEPQEPEQAEEVAGEGDVKVSIIRDNDDWSYAAVIRDKNETVVKIV
ncbi:uncharacterized protein TrAtP1_010344 [Trichoderma atroviride]|uniref:uncharacterized protein n=1 Tax=Hypocrea atroviridis TaxID=63577 RepID=UPI003323A1F8|nr:hypothetical protein TrAtP1_010344 [Trichoderma atroviride]